MQRTEKSRCLPCVASMGKKTVFRAVKCLVNMNCRDLEICKNENAEALGLKGRTVYQFRAPVV